MNTMSGNKQYSVSLCSGRTAYEVMTNTKIDLMDIAPKLDCRVSTRYILITYFGDAEISLYPSGRMLIKKVKDEAEALDIAGQFMEHIGV